MVDVGRLPRTIELKRIGDGAVLDYVDQTLLPGELVVKTTSNWRDVVDAIKTLAVRGAPAIGVSGAAAVVLRAYEGGTRDEWLAAAAEIAMARPTAVNLSWAIERVCAEIRSFDGSDEQLRDHLLTFVKQLEKDDEACNRAIGANGAELLKPASRILTHCNAGSLATVFYGTALGVVYAAAEQGKVQQVFADETRPVGQGARLTSWELARAGVPVTLICDNMAASVMAAGKVDAVLVGADRIARNGDVANKIGTYGLAVLAHAHAIPFYVAAPKSTIDVNTPDGTSIVIEQRDPNELLARPIVGVDVFNPAFDVTPASLVTAVITEEGIYAPHEVFNIAGI